MTSMETLIPNCLITDSKSFFMSLFLLWTSLKIGVFLYKRGFSSLPQKCLYVNAHIFWGSHRCVIYSINKDSKGRLWPTNVSKLIELLMLLDCWFCSCCEFSSVMTQKIKNSLYFVISVFGRNFFPATQIIQG